ncbi:MAG: hypothetical protein IJH04_06150 [Eggerthellaceae bacterium]|nr:hypothetical protein [Eggerthellaceae bacterium]
MTVQTELLLMKTYSGFQVLEYNTKQTMFSKNTIHPQIEAELKRAIANNDDYALGMILTGLFEAAIQGGWGNAPAGYHMKHNGYMFGQGLLTRNGTRADLTFTVRTNGYIT